MLAVVVVGYAAYCVSYVSGIDDYISDECWYVSASRNILLKYFNVALHGRWNGTRVNLILETPLNSFVYGMWEAEVKEGVKDLGGTVIKGVNYYKYKEDGNFLPAVCADIPSNNLSAARMLPHVKRCIVGYCYPNSKDIVDYMNYEHPPLSKYLIALFMMMLGDDPVSWRLPSILAGTVTLILVYLTLKLVIRDEVGGLLGVIAALATALDPLFRSMSMVAMLDIYVALFTYLSLYSTLRDSLGGASLALALAFSSKFSGAFAGIPALIEWVRKEVPAKVLLFFLYTSISVFIALAVPIIIHEGLMNWWSNSVEGAFRWHLSIKTTGGPPQAMPWDWLVGRNPFVLHYAYDKVKGEWVADLVARGNIYIYLLTSALSLFILPVIRSLPDRGSVFIYAWGTYLMYIIAWVVGVKTQYSFYMVQVTPMLYTMLFIIIHYLTTPLANTIYVARRWYKIFKILWDWLSGVARITLRVEVKYVEPA
ncbi:MAG: glycosyltransferase family 39 protein [Desulfurococcales archaeon]|nr:glycosyltransferase family 39 protein [Desulfurococcales archaeon]